MIKTVPISVEIFKKHEMLKKFQLKASLQAMSASMALGAILSICRGMPLKL